MAPTIYASPYPPVPIVDHSIFTSLFSSPHPDNVGCHPASTPAFVDAHTGTTLTRATLNTLPCLSPLALRPTHRHVLSAERPPWCIPPIPSHGPSLSLAQVIAAGVRCTLANSAYTARELAYQYKDSSARLLFTAEDGLPVVRQMFKEVGVDDSEAAKRIIVIGNGLQWAGGPSAPSSPEALGLLKFEDLLGKGALGREELFDGELAHETSYLCYSSGTTGKPKGVESTHKNIVSELAIVKSAFSELTRGEIVLGFLPFYHIYGAVKLLHYPFTRGATVVVMPRFDPVQFCANIEQYKITVALVVPPVLVLLARHPAVDQYDMSSLKILFSGAAPLGAALTKQVIKRLGDRRKGKGNEPPRIMQGYGLTETSPATHLLPVPDGSRKVGSVGLLLPNLEARLVIDGEGDGNVDAKVGEPGELWIRGPTVMKGYLNNVAATKDCITHDKWFKTGDIAIRDPEGYFYIIDRRKELIKYKGFQVPPAELESVLLTHPDVADVAVIGVESAKEATELPRAYIVPARPDSIKTDAEMTALALAVQKWIQTKVARHKFLRGGVVIIDAVPKSAAGKILRRELRERAKQELAGRDPADDIVKAKL
ncbi:AMP binding protein [Cyathus striatus]|nr:AMP binding protein [Cyathus striatus]